MYDVLGSYEAVLFGIMDDIVPSADTIPIFLDIFRDKGFLPNTFREINLLSAPPQNKFRLKLYPPNGEWNIEFLSNRIVIQKLGISSKGANLGPLETFVKDVADFSTRILKQFPRKTNRLALVTQGLLREMSEQKLQEIYRTLFRPPKLYEDNPPFEWNARYASRIIDSISGQEEQINIISKINRIRGEIAEPDGLIPFDRIELGFDINTYQGNNEPRFDLASLENFYTIAVSWNIKLLAELETYLNA